MLADDGRGRLTTLSKSDLEVTGRASQLLEKTGEQLLIIVNIIEDTVACVLGS